MQGLSTSEEPRRKSVQYLFGKHATVSNSDKGALDANDLDRLLTRLPNRFYDCYLDGAPTINSVEALVRLGVSRWARVSRGVVGEVFELIKARRSRGLASIRQARYLCEVTEDRK
jgi:hypothetical protein